MEYISSFQGTLKQVRYRYLNCLPTTTIRYLDSGGYPARYTKTKTKTNKLLVSRYIHHVRHVQYESKKPVSCPKRHVINVVFVFFSSSSSSFKLFDAVRAYVFEESGGQLYHPGTLNRTPFETDQVFTGNVRTRRLRYLPVCARTYLLLPLLLLLLSCLVQVSGV